MKKTLFVTAMLAVSAGIFSFVPAKIADTLTVDAAHSKIDWSGAANDHYHPGTVMLKGGSITVDNGKITGGKFVIDLTTIKVTDAAGERLEGHLKSPDFFDAAKMGEATYEITTVNYTSENTADITGNLSVKGLTIPVTLTAKVRGWKDGKLFAEAFFSLDSKALGFAKYSADVAVHLFATK